MDAEVDLKPGVEIESHPNENSGNRPTENDIGWWHDDLRLLVTLSGTEYLFEKLKTEDLFHISGIPLFIKERSKRNPAGIC